MADTQPIPIRLSDDIVARLDHAAKRIGTSRAGIVRFCVETWLRHFEIKGVASLPVNWDEIMATNDGRKKQARAQIPFGYSGRKLDTTPPNSAPASSEPDILDVAEQSVENERRARLRLPKVDAPSDKASPPKRGAGRSRSGHTSPRAPTQAGPKAGEE